MIRRLLLLASVAIAPLAAQDRRDESFYYPGSFNWQFLARYPEGAKLFNAFDYGHAVLYERLLALDSVRAVPALAREYDFLTTDLLVRPPRFSVAEEVIAPRYAKLAWPAKEMFEWAHVLHRQLYDVYADPRLDDAAKRALVERITDFYLADAKYAFLAEPKAMSLMDDQHFSQRFRRQHPQFNGLIWAYHWLQVGLYEPLLTETTAEAKRAGVRRVVDGFWAMVREGRYPETMPMTIAIAPVFSARHPRAAAIFDNLHMMHDIISDILVHPTWSDGEKRAEILRQVEEMQRPGTNLMGWDEWKRMGQAGGHVH